MAKGQHLSPNQRTFQRFLKNKPGVFGLWAIVVAVILALLSYVIAPDNTPNANDQITELGLVSPGFSIDVLKVRKNRQVEGQFFMKTMLFGKENPYKMIPINAYEIVRDSLIAEVFQSGETTNKKIEKYHLVDIVYALERSSKGIEKRGDNFQFITIEGREEERSIKELQKTVESDLIRKKSFILGSDKFGRDILSRLIIGVRTSLIVGLIAVIISLTIGILLGALAGFFGGRIDELIMLLINAVWSVPTLLLVFAIVLAFGRGIGIIFLAVGLTMWVDVARIVRGQVLALRKVQYVEAAQSLGFSNPRIIIRHILPNILGPVMVIAAANFATAILVEAGLSYLGFGIQPPQPSWGNMLNENYGYLISGSNPFAAIAPGIAIMLMVLAFNLVGNALRDALDVKAK